MYLFCWKDDFSPRKACFFSWNVGILAENVPFQRPFFFLGFGLREGTKENTNARGPTQTFLPGLLEKGDERKLIQVYLAYDGGCKGITVLPGLSWGLVNSSCCDTQKLCMHCNNCICTIVHCIIIPTGARVSPCLLLRGGDMGQSWGRLSKVLAVSWEENHWEVWKIPRFIW